MANKPKQSRFVPVPTWTPIDDEERHNGEVDRELKSLITDARDRALRFLNDKGWTREAGEAGQGNALPFKKIVDGKLHILIGVSDDTDPKVGVAHEIYQKCEYALDALKKGECERAAGWAYLAGHYSGKISTLLAESRSSASRKKGRTSVPDQVYLKAIRKAGKGATYKVIASHLPAEVYQGVQGDSADRESSHRKRITALKKSLEKH